MDIRRDLKEQYHAALAMLTDCIKRCPEDVWVSGTYPRMFWRIVFHTAFFAHLYIGQNEAAFQPWPAISERFHDAWRLDANVEPYELPAAIDPLSRQDALAYVAFIDSLIDLTIDNLDLDTEDSGFPWYSGISKLSHEIMSLRHIQGHVGQLSEVLMAHGIDTKWIGKIAS